MTSHAVGALQVVGGKASIRGVIERLEAHDDTVVHANDIVRLLLKGGLFLLRREALVVREVQVGDATAMRFADLAEHAPRLGVHGRGKGLVEIVRILIGEVTGLAAVLVLDVACREQEQGRQKKGKGSVLHAQPNSFFSAKETRSKWKSLSTPSISACMRSLHRLPMLPSWVWCICLLGTKRPASMSSPTCL